MFSKLLRPLTVAALLLSASATDAHAQAPDAAQVREAADRFDAGAAAFKAKAYEEAASHFEAADAAVPSANALRLAFRARSMAGQLDRAASLAALAKERHPDDAETVKGADEILKEAKDKLGRIAVTCESSCVLAVGMRSIHGAPQEKWTVYLEPGEHDVSASFDGDDASTLKTVTAKAGGVTTVRFEPDTKAAPVGPPPPPEDPPPTGGEDNGNEGPDDGSSDGLHPAWFFVGLAATAGVGGVTIWSGIDTQNNPGEDVVREECRGQGTDCEEYQTGVAAQNRTNILIGATGGAAAITIVLALLTDWGGDDAAAAGLQTLTPVLSVGDGAAIPTGLGVRATF